jgi:hypothetical protein
MHYPVSNLQWHAITQMRPMWFYIQTYKARCSFTDKKNLYEDKNISIINIIYITDIIFLRV